VSIFFRRHPMGPEPALVPVAGIGALRRLPLFQAIALRVAPAGPFLCPDEAAGAVGVTVDLAPAGVLRLCGKIPTGEQEPTAFGFLSASGRFALTLQRGWVSTTVGLVDRERQPLQEADYFSVQEIATVTEGARTSPRSPGTLFHLSQGDVWVTRSPDGFKGAASPAGAMAVEVLLVADQPWPFPVQILRSVIHFERPNGRPDLEEPWDGRTLDLRFALVEGTQQTETLHFRVLKRVTQLRKVVMTSKIGLLVDTTAHPLGDFDPREEPYAFTFPRSEVPEGFFVRGHYTQAVLFESAEGPALLPTANQFEILARPN